jgi:DNA gyrase/topoisomerase IV subunit A
MIFGLRVVSQFCFNKINDQHPKYLNLSMILLYFFQQRDKIVNKNNGIHLIFIKEYILLFNSSFNHHIDFLIFLVSNSIFLLIWRLDCS